MHFVSFIVAFIFVLVAAILFGCGLVRLYRNQSSRSLIGTGFTVGLAGIVIAAILFGFFSL